MRRNRRLAVIGAAAVAVAAVAVPSTLLGDGTGRSDRPPPVVTTPDRAVAPTPRADGSFPLTLDVPDGEVPAGGFLAFDDQQLVTPDGTFDLPGDFVQLTPYGGDGWVGIRTGDLPPTGHQVVVLDADFREVSAASSGPSLVVSDDRSRVAWMLAEGNGPDWTVVNAPVDGGEPVTLPTQADTVVEGFLTEDTVATSWLDQTTGETFYGEAVPPVPGQSEGAGVFDAPTLDGYQTVGGVSATAGLVAGQTEFNGDSTCSQVRTTDTAEERLVHETCDFRLGPFSPDGGLLVGFASYFDLGSPTLAVLDSRTGEPVVEWTSGNAQADAAMVMSAQWVDDDTVAAVVEQSGEQSVLTFELNGSVTRSTEPRPAEMSIEFYLPGVPFGQ